MKREKSLWEFMKNFGGVIYILLLEQVSIDIVKQAIKEVILSNSQFFTSISLKPPESVDDLFQCANNQYAILKDDLAACEIK